MHTDEITNSKPVSFSPIVNGKLPLARQHASPNFNQRPPHTAVSLLVIHNISLPPRQFGGGFIEAFFSNELNVNLHPYFKSIADLKVSAHCLIDRLGGVTQFVSFDQRAWHAGRSVFNGVRECNDYSIGVELEGADDIAYTYEQYKSLVAVTQAIMKQYPKITLDRIVGHNDIAPARKTDPGESFDWVLFKQMLIQTKS